MSDSDSPETPPSSSAHGRSMGLDGILASLRKRWFLLGVVVVIVLARLYPFLGAKGGGLDPWACLRFFSCLVQSLPMNQTGGASYGYE